MEDKLDKDKITKVVKEVSSLFNFHTVDKSGNMHFEGDNCHIVLGAQAAAKFHKVMEEEFNKQFKQDLEDVIWRNSYKQ